ncbi:MAG: KpsF/GutQ family sugar-phosphate isomerase [Gammaproteobacteria bacterium]|nr:KpsF/GutQ family sugar-phosphate isomerase [Gammaproteobacteria bacterium]
METEALQRMGRKVLEIELAALQGLLPRIDAAFARACQLMLACRGRVVVMGMGKSGHVGNKLAATLASTGTPAFFVHPGEASHGDLGMITRQDVVVAISYSGESPEIVTLLPLIKRLGVPLICMTGKPGSTMAKSADVHVDVSVPQEACPLNLAPTASTTAALAMGDALAIALLEARGFTEEDFARTHPGGSLGKRLLLKVRDIMHTGDRVPRVTPDTPLDRALLEMTRKGLGVTAIVDGQERVIGVYTDGDLRRTLDRGIDVHKARIDEVMTPGGKTAKADWLAAQALQWMERHRVTVLLVVGEDDKLEGVLHMHDLMRAGVV